METFRSSCGCDSCRGYNAYHDKLDGIVGVMATTLKNPYRAMISMSSDHAGLNRELGRLQKELYSVMALVRDARAVRDYIRYLDEQSARWLDLHYHG